MLQIFIETIFNDKPMSDKGTSFNAKTAWF